MIKIHVKLRRKFIFFEYITIEDNKGSKYSAKFSYDGYGFLVRDSRLVFEGDVFEKSFSNKYYVKCSQPYAPKDFIFHDERVLKFSGYTELGKLRHATLVLNDTECAKITFEKKLMAEDYFIEIDSDDEAVIDMVLYAFMHDFYWEHIVIF